MHTGEHKIIFTGPVGAGKTSAIACISDIPPVSTDVDATDETALKKNMTTVAMDYGYIKLGDEDYVHLYGTPGQERFNFMWEILCQGGIGLIVLIDATSPSPADDTRFYLSSFANFIEETGAVIGITRADLASNLVYDQIQDLVIELGHPIPVIEVDARNHEDVKTLVHALLAVV